MADSAIIGIGVDIGTSQSSVALWNGYQVELLKIPVNQTMIESCVTFLDDRPSGGLRRPRPLVDEMIAGNSIFNMKRLIGRMDTDPVVQESKNVPFLVQNLDIGIPPFVAALVNKKWRFHTPEEAMATFLVELRMMAEEQLKRPLRNVVVTFPVSFSRFQLSRLERACAMAGIHVLRLMPEPAAVAMLYGQQQQKASHEKIALIFNMGAGYTDVAVATTKAGVTRIIALAGSTIGGEDLLQNLMHHIFPESESVLKSRGVKEIEAIALLRFEVQLAIRGLCSETCAPIIVDLQNGHKICKDIYRNEFEEVNRKVFEECESLIFQCLKDADMEVEDVNDVIVVGGCSHILTVKNLVRSIFNGKKLYEGINPLDAAVRGAAMEAAVACGITDSFGNMDLFAIQATTHTVGIQADGNNFVPVIPRNARIPARKEQVLTTINDNQTEALIIIYEGEGNQVEENHLLGYFKIMEIPAAPKGVPVIKVSMDIDVDNALRVFAEVVMPGSRRPAFPPMEVKMPTVDDAHGWCAEALHRDYGSRLGLAWLGLKT